MPLDITAAEGDNEEVIDDAFAGPVRKQDEHLTPYAKRPHNPKSGCIMLINWSPLPSAEFCLE